MQALLTYDNNFQLRAKGYGIQVCQLAPGRGDGARALPASRKQLLEDFFSDVIPAPNKVGG